MNNSLQYGIGLPLSMLCAFCTGATYNHSPASAYFGVATIIFAALTIRARWMMLQEQQD